MAEAKNRAYSRPVFDQHITIQLEQTQRVFEREFPRVVSALYAIDVILRIIGDDREIDEVEGMVGAMIGECAKDIQNEKGRIEKVREDNGITSSPRYANPEQVEYALCRPRSPSSWHCYRRWTN